MAKAQGADQSMDQSRGQSGGQMHGRGGQPKAPRHLASMGLAWVDAIIVARHARRGNVGRKLMEGVASWAHDKGAQAVALEVYASNSSARAFYQALGFEPVRLRLERAL